MPLFLWRVGVSATAVFLHDIAAEDAVVSNGNLHTSKLH